MGVVARKRESLALDETPIYKFFSLLNIIGGMFCSHCSRFNLAGSRSLAKVKGMS